MPPITDPTVEQYITDLVPARDPAFAALEADAQARHQPIVGPLEGQFLSILVASAGAKRILELGTNIGYSGVWFGRAVAPLGGRVDTIELEPEKVAEARRHFAELGLGEVVTVHQGDALSVLDRLTGPYDVVFNDLLRSFGDPDAMPRLLNRSIELTRVGGLIIADNALHTGEIVGEPPSRSARAVKVYGQLASRDARLETVIVPLRDGIAISRRQA